MKPDTRGFKKDHMEYLVSHAQQFHAPTDDFSDEEESEESEKQREDEIDNLASGSPPNVLGPSKPSMPLAKPMLP